MESRKYLTICDGLKSSITKQPQFIGIILAKF